MRTEVYPARESKISRLLEFEADVEKLRPINSRLIAQIQRLETERNKVAQKLSKVGTNRSTRELWAIEGGSPYDHIAGLSYRVGDHFYHNRERPISGLDKSEIRPPKRSARVLSGYTMLGRQIDVIETSRGCTFDCSFYSIVEMRGRNFETFSFGRVIADIQDAYDYGARSIFIVDDNITLNVKRFEGLCEAIIAAGLNSIDYSVQAMTSALADHGERLAPLMRRAGFRYVPRDRKRGRCRSRILTR
jgi:radical SAM superfamily enzyme YgiQ (UPF0313 family)